MLTTVGKDCEYSVVGFAIANLKSNHCINCESLTNITYKAIHLLTCLISVMYQYILITMLATYFDRWKVGKFSST